MSRLDVVEELEAKRRLLSSVYPAWPDIKPILAARINLLTGQLVSENSEEIRGRIKELKQLVDFDVKLLQDIKDLENSLNDSGQTANFLLE